MTKAWVKYTENSVSDGNFVLQPLKKGFGITLGNCLRRVLLSSLEGCAMVAVKIDGVPHEYSTIPDVVEDVLDILCNLKEVVYKSAHGRPATLELNVSGSKKVLAADIVCSDGISVVNTDLYLFETNASANVKILIYVESGYGYRDSNSLRSSSADNDVNVIFTDASFSPVLKSNHEVSMVRVGKSLDYDQLNFSIVTNGSIDPCSALTAAVQILNENLQVFETINQEPENESDEDVEVEDLKMQSILNMTVDELELSARSSNCLKRAGIDSVNELLQKDMSELVQIKNFGKKSADEINSRLKQFNLILKGTEEE